MKAFLSSPYLKSSLLWIVPMITFDLSLAQPKPIAMATEARRSYHIGEQSTLTLEGTTNVNQFSCRCTESFPPQVYYATPLKDENCTSVFRNTSLTIRAKSLDCGNKMMNKDMYEALNANTFPEIKIALLQVAEERCDFPGEEMNWAKFNALTRITLNGQDQEYWMQVIVRKVGARQFRFIADKELQMSDFGIVPPTAALGMVKVKEEIKISLDMWVTIE